MVEHRIENPCVPGSSPGSTTSMNKDPSRDVRVFCFKGNLHLIPRLIHPYRIKRNNLDVRDLAKILQRGSNPRH